jgi:glucose/arabinose dehydrogenase
MKKPWIKKLRWLACLCAGFAVLVPALRDAPSSAAQAQQEPASVNAIQLQPVLTTGLASPVYVTNAKDGSNRLFIVELGGTIKVLQPGQTTPTNFLNITSRVVQNGGERGLLGLAFHPQYTQNGRFFVYYTRSSDGQNVVAEYRVSANNPNLASTNEIVHLAVANPFTNHNGGMIEFGPDGYLYIAKGDGGDANDPGNRSQNIDILLGKILRIDVNTPNGSVPYSSPSTNPFFGATPGRDEIYAYGLRNPWRFSFDRSTGQLICADVGQGQWEEIDIITLGGNYGWRVFEGNHCTNLDAALCANPSNYIFPIAEYQHTGGRCSITGGYAYRGSIGTFPAGAYIYGDLCTGEIFQLVGTTQTPLLDTSLSISSFGEDEAGEIYVVGIGGSVNRLVNPDATCSFSVAPLNPSIRAIGGSATVVVTAPVNCGWTAVSNSPSITITGGSSGTGVGAVTFTVPPNPGGLRTATLTVAGQTVTLTQSAKEELFDFDGDARTDISVFRTDAWLILNSSTGNSSATGFGLSGDMPVPGDYDGDFKTDLAIWRPSVPRWFVRNSSTGATTSAIFGVSSDVPVPGDYDGDGKTDLALWRSSSSDWIIINSTNPTTTQTITFGLSTDIPVPGDFDGDGRTDIAVWRSSTTDFFIRNSSNGTTSVITFGLPSDRPVLGDYDGDGKTDVAVWRSSTTDFFIRNSSNGSVSVVTFGLPSDVPVPGDYNGDGRFDVAVWRPSNGFWFIRTSANGPITATSFGASGDIPLPSVYQP